MATATTILQSAMRKLGLLASGESATANELTDGLECLNDMLATWSIDQVSLAYSTQETLSLVSGTAVYTIGPGADFDTVKPIEILTAFIRDANHYDHVLQIRPVLEHDKIALKTIDNRPHNLYYKYGHPTGIIYFDYEPVTIEALHLNSIKHLTAFPDATTDLDIASELKSALVYNVAIELAPEYSVQPSGSINTRAYKTLGLLKSLSISNLLIPITLSMPGISAGVYNIDSDI